MTKAIDTLRDPKGCCRACFWIDGYEVQMDFNAEGVPTYRADAVPVCLPLVQQHLETPKDSLLQLPQEVS